MGILRRHTNRKKCLGPTPRRTGLAVDMDDEDDGGIRMILDESDHGDNLQDDNSPDDNIIPAEPGAGLVVADVQDDPPIPWRSEGIRRYDEKVRRYGYKTAASAIVVRA